MVIGQKREREKKDSYDRNLENLHFMYCRQLMFSEQTVQASSGPNSVARQTLWCVVQSVQRAAGDPVLETRVWTKPHRRCPKGSELGSLHLAGCNELSRCSPKLYGRAFSLFLSLSTGGKRSGLKHKQSKGPRQAQLLPVRFKGRPICFRNWRETEALILSNGWQQMCYFVC